MAAGLDSIVEDFRHSPLTDAGPFTFVTADALTMKVREGGRVIDAVALPTRSDRNQPGRRRLAVLPHPLRLQPDGRHPKAMWPAVKAMLHSVCDQPDAAAVHASSTGYWTTSKPSSQPCSRTSTAPELTRWPSPPSARTRGPRSGPTTPAERLSRKIRRRTDAVGIFPNRDASVCLVGGVLAEQADEWTDGRRYLGLDVLARPRMNLVPTAEPEIGADDLPTLTA